MSLRYGLSWPPLRIRRALNERDAQFSGLSAAQDVRLDTQDVRIDALSASLDALISSGSFSVTLTGVDAPASSEAFWQRTEDQVMIWVNGVTGTSDSSTATLTGLPENLHPVTTQNNLAWISDNGVTDVGRVRVGNNGVITLFVGFSNDFTAANTKGLQGTVLSYFLSSV